MASYSDGQYATLSAQPSLASEINLIPVWESTRDLLPERLAVSLKRAPEEFLHPLSGPATIPLTPTAEALARISLPFRTNLRYSGEGGGKQMELTAYWPLGSEEPLDSISDFLLIKQITLGKELTGARPTWLWLSLPEEGTWPIQLAHWAAFHGFEGLLSKGDSREPHHLWLSPGGKAWGTDRLELLWMPDREKGPGVTASEQFARAVGLQKPTEEGGFPYLFWDSVGETARAGRGSGLLPLNWFPLGLISWNNTFSRPRFTAQTISGSGVDRVLQRHPGATIAFRARSNPGVTPTASRIRRARRAVDQALREAGFWAAIAALEGANHPGAAFREAGELAIQGAYNPWPWEKGRGKLHVEFAREEILYQSVDLSRAITRHAVNYLCSTFDFEAPQGLDDSGFITVFNSSGVERNELVPLPSFGPGRFQLVDDAGLSVPMATVAFGSRSTRRVRCFPATDVPPYGYRTYFLVPARVGALRRSPGIRVESGDNWISNSEIRVEFDPGSGAINRIVQPSTGKTLVSGPIAPAELQLDGRGNVQWRPAQSEQFESRTESSAVHVARNAEWQVGARRIIMVTTLVPGSDEVRVDLYRIDEDRESPLPSLALSFPREGNSHAIGAPSHFRLLEGEGTAIAHDWFAPAVVSGIPRWIRPKATVIPDSIYIVCPVGRMDFQRSILMLAKALLQQGISCRVVYSTDDVTALVGSRGEDLVILPADESMVRGVSALREASEAIPSGRADSEFWIPKSGATPILAIQAHAFRAACEELAESIGTEIERQYPWVALSPDMRYVSVAPDAVYLADSSGVTEDPATNVSQMSLRILPSGKVPTVQLSQYARESEVPMPAAISIRERRFQDLVVTESDESWGRTFFHEPTERETSKTLFSPTLSLVRTGGGSAALLATYVHVAETQPFETLRIDLDWICEDTSHEVEFYRRPDRVELVDRSRDAWYPADSEMPVAVENLIPYSRTRIGFEFDVPSDNRPEISLAADDFGREKRYSGRSWSRLEAVPSSPKLSLSIVPSDLENGDGFDVTLLNTDPSEKLKGRLVLETPPGVTASWYEIDYELEPGDGFTRLLEIDGNMSGFLRVSANLADGIYWDSCSIGGEPRLEYQSGSSGITLLRESAAPVAMTVTNPHAQRVEVEVRLLGGRNGWSIGPMPRPLVQVEDRHWQFALGPHETREITARVREMDWSIGWRTDFYWKISWEDQVVFRGPVTVYGGASS